MKIKKIIIISIILFFKINYLYSEDINFEAEDMDIKENGNTIFAYNSFTNIKSENIDINSKKVKYDKKEKIIIFTENVIFNDKANKIKIYSDKIIYNQKSNIVTSYEDTNFKIDNKYKIFSKDIFYDRTTQDIYSNEETIIEDNDKNIYKLKEKFNFDVTQEVIKSKKSLVLDKNDNKYIFDNIIINLKNKEIAGKEIKIEFEDSYFGNESNDPIVKGRSGHSNKDKLKVYKAVFSTCNIENKRCRGWELYSDEFNHDKEKKIFEYKKSWLKIFDFKVFYLPYFNHPDPSIKRKSGFLTPSYASSESLGTSINTPYYKVLGIDRDITFSPRFYADKSFLLQNEYRQVLEDSKVLSDFGFLVGNDGTKAHLFYNQIGNFDNIANYVINLQSVKGDNYLKTHDLKETSLLVKNTDLLLSNLSIDWKLDEASLTTSVKMYEDLSRNDHDRYAYIFPDFSFKRNIGIPDEYNGSFNFTSSGYNKFYDTNVRNTVLINNFLFTSNDFISPKGLVTKYYMLLKNANSNTDYSSNLSNEEEYNLFQTLKLDLSIPLIKQLDNYTHLLSPIISLRYSPNGNDDISSNSLILNYDNAFAMDRISTNTQVEGGEAMTVGIKFSRENLLQEKILEARVGNVLRIKENESLPSKSKLGQTRSDIFGDIKFNLNRNLGIGYAFSYDKDLEYSNLDAVNILLSVNNFETNFNYYTENHDFGDSETLTNLTRYEINNENNLVFNASKNLRDDFTEYYNLAYEYETDCISLNFNYKRTFYRDGNLEPNNTLSFLIRIIPFTELGVPNVGSMIKN